MQKTDTPRDLFAVVPHSNRAKSPGNSSRRNSPWRNRSAAASLLFLLLVPLFFLTPVATVFAEGNTAITLDNGLKVFVKEMPSAPVVAINIWLHVGSRNEKDGEEGYSHIIEHMLFKGTASYPVGMLDREIKKLGASQNAFTASDYTCYHVLGAKEQFSRLMELEADAVLHSSFPEEEFQKERQVVLEELRMSKDDPDSVCYRLLKETAYRVHPYRHPILGYEQSLASATRDSLVKYYQKYYVPSNMMVTVVGDVKKDEVVDAVKKFMGSAPRGEIPSQVVASEPMQILRREARQYGDVQQAYLRLAWHVPGIESPDNYVLDMISTMMGKGRSSRLHKTLVESERLATKIETDYFTSGDPSLFIINAELPQGNIRKFVDRATNLLYALSQIPSSADGRDKGGKDPIPGQENLKAEFEKTRQQIIASTIFDRETAEPQALAYGHYGTLGRLEECDTYIDRIRAVTLDDVRRVAGQMFYEGNLTVVSYEPQIATGVVKPEMITLENGVRLILKENHSSPLVAMSVQVDAGGMREDRNDAGLANLTASVLLKGTEKRSADEIARAIEALGTTLTTKAQKNFTSLKVISLTENFLPSLDLALDLLVNPSFPEEELRKEQDKALESIKAQQDDLFFFTYYNTLGELFPDHPLGYSTLGITDRVKKIKRSDIVQFHKKHYIGKGVVVSIVGDFYAREIKEALTKALGAIPAGNLPEMKDIRLPALQTAKEVVAQKNREQAQILFAVRTFTRNDPRNPAMDVLKNILSGSMCSRLFVNLRDKESLAYAVWASNVGTSDQGYFFATLSTAVNKLEKGRTRLIEELTKVRTEGFSDEEFTDAKSYLLGQYALNLIDNISQAESFSADEFFGLGFDYCLRYPDIIRNVKKEDVVAVAKEFMAQGGYLVGITKP